MLQPDRDPGPLPQARRSRRPATVTSADADRAPASRLVAACDYETLVQSSYSPGCMQRRNRYMVDHAALLLAVHNGQPGGTRRTMEYAMRRGLQIVDIPPVMEP